MEEQNQCCDSCANSAFALKGKQKEKFGGICGLTCECHVATTQQEGKECVKPVPPVYSDWKKYCTMKAGECQSDAIVVPINVVSIFIKAVREEAIRECLNCVCKECYKTIERRV